MMTVKEFLSYALDESCCACKVYDFAAFEVVLDTTIEDVLDSKYAEMEFLSFDVGTSLCVNVDSDL